ncbi:MAG: RNB domain-containing ribonuclease [Acidobacteria bacterium]|nr:RNB domain-containing ribonuclease [Acidobacteriota bacterium]
MSDARPGDLIDIFEAGDVVTAVILSEEKGRLKIALETGGEIRIPASRVVHVAARGAPVEPRLALQAAARHGADARSRAEAIDVPSLWDLLVDEGGRHSTADLAGLALGEAAPANASAVLRRLSAEKTWFERKGEKWEARSREEVDDSLNRQRALAEKERRRADFIDRAREALRAGKDAPRFAPGPADALFLRKLVDLAVLADEAPDRKEAVALAVELDSASHATPAGAFDLLVRLGVFDTDENLDIHRFGLRTAFPAEVEAAASVAATRAVSGRRDLTGLPCVTIDDPETLEIDDALSWEGGAGDSGTVGIHIAAPSAFILPGDIVDEEALRRAATYYFPGRRLAMIPKAISEEAASLNPGAIRPALTFFATFDEEGRLLRHEIVPSIVRSARRMSYEEADAALLSGPLRALHLLADRLERERVAAGAVVIRAPEIVVKVKEGGRVEVTRLDERGPSRRLVAEMMILANRLAAEHCRDRGIPAIYRRQPPPEVRLPPIPEGEYDPVAVRALRRSMRRGEVCLSPALHFGLGLEAYLQATSPIRRFQDLAVQRQIEAQLAGRPLPYDAEALARIAATTDEAERAARRAENSSDEYWILKYLAGRIGETVEGVIVAVETRKTEIELVETLRVVTLAPRPDHRAGTRVKLVIDSVRPREGILKVREV